MKYLHPGAKWSFRVGLLFVALVISGFLSSWIVAIRFASSIALSYIIVFAVLAILIEIYVGLAYINWKYEFGKTELRVEKGVIWKTYKSIPYSRVQNIDIKRGILARMLGFSTLNIQTAGYSAYGKGGGMMAEGYIPAVSVSEAEQVRKNLIKKIGKRSGL